MQKIFFVLMFVSCFAFSGCKKEVKNYPIEIVDRNIVFSPNENPDPLLLVVSAAKDGKIKLNNIETGTLENLEILSAKLKIVFNDREKAGLEEREVLIDLRGGIEKKDLDALVSVLKNVNAEPIRFIKDK